MECYGPPKFIANEYTLLLDRSDLGEALPESESVTQQPYGVFPSEGDKFQSVIKHSCQVLLAN